MTLLCVGQIMLRQVVVSLFFSLIILPVSYTRSLIWASDDTNDAYSSKSSSSKTSVLEDRSESNPSLLPHCSLTAELTLETKALVNGKLRLLCLSQQTRHPIPFSAPHPW